MKISLKYKFVAILFCSLLLAVIGQLLTRYVFEIPTLIRLETQADTKDVERVRLALFQMLRRLVLVNSEDSAWTASYEFMETMPGDPKHEDYKKSNVSDYTFDSYNVDGMVFIDKAGNTRFNFQRSTIQQVIVPPKINVDFPLSADITIDEEYITEGVTRTNIGPVIFAAAYIVTDEQPYPVPAGVLIHWRLLDKTFFNSISKNLQIKLDFIPITETANNKEWSLIAERLQARGTGNLPRDENGKLYWFFRDSENQPVFLVEQGAEKRTFSEDILSASMLVGFSCSAFIMFFLLVFFSRAIMKRLDRARTTMLEVIEENDYERRLSCGDSDELDIVFSRFNDLLAHIENQQKKLVEQNQVLAELSEKDALTGVPNRRYLEEVLGRCWRHCLRYKKEMSVLMIDVDYFKPFNDTYGHPAGDQVLIKIAQTLQDNLHRSTDYLARYGGEEFCIVLNDTDPEASMSVAERLRSEIESLRIPSDVSQCAEVVTVSIGVAVVTPDEKVIQMDVIKTADKALYEAKRLGRNCVHLYQGESLEKTDATTSI